MTKILERRWKNLYNVVQKRKIKEITYMKPRIFISSTFYDLKYVREDLANFVKSYGYEPVLFEDGDIGYKPGNNLDTSCYDAMKNADMVILIIGGEYGSAATGEEKDEFKEYMSVTRNEFRTAADSGIPIFVMIDKKVMTEYGVYEANYNSIEEEGREIKFSSTKNINVFRFIKEVKNIIILPIQEFEKSADIKEFISKQWADMFKNYLSSLRNETENKKIENSVNEMKSLIQKMDIMLDSVGKNVLSKENPEEYKNIINQQEILSFCDILITSILFKRTKKRMDSEKRKIVTNILAAIKEIKKNKIFDNKTFDNSDIERNIYMTFINYELTIKHININSFRIVYDKSDILYDNKKLESVINVLLKDKYFYNFYILQ